MVLGAALANNDGAGLSRLSAKQFHAEAFTFGIATIARTTGSFLVSHVL
jgi:hypothetical protein